MLWWNRMPVWTRAGVAQSVKATATTKGEIKCAEEGATAQGTAAITHKEQVEKGSFG
jgi:hypothetical protein